MRWKMFKKNILGGVILSLFMFASSAYAGRVDLTTYYPAPFGEYTNLWTQELHFEDTGGTPTGLINFDYVIPRVYDGRLRITAGFDDLNNNSQGASIDLHGNNNTGRLDLVAGRGSNIVFHTSPAAAVAQEVMSINSNGFVAVGTGGPSEKLSIFAGNGWVDAAHSWRVASDARLKKNVTTLNGSLEKVLAVRGVRFDLIADKEVNPGEGKHIGFIAQELEKEFPEVVATDKEGMKSVAYDKMTAVLVEAVKEQQKEIDLLKEEIAELKKR